MSHKRVQFSRSHYIASFVEYVVELSLGLDLIDLGVEENAELKRKAKDSKLKKMKRDLETEALRLGLSPAEVERIAVRCGLERDIAVCLATEFARKSFTRHRMAG